ncbi:hypothetical protein XMM379_002498 [Aliiroseovarius sp. xm-m-379]|nr:MULTISPECIES: helix-turn-helix domain-containing protein [unclassified Aliiroseovarius]NRP11589.1 hypothetical protein [Aliiroseovarius sp. xm-d-517]NRP25798.1 hypothetical protein [Aliiroseovarius sp. xm-m-379]NRP34597.1 hypothetical protein [Aliiroseovarius sp. xm-a-104]NRP42031.1 hypothetical protein [Aliiroseovarius sp. xm-m-339-2]NRP45035.1 hypothetical protein [Aliiroseovarius sp. xm-m-378]NRP51061.1 hypothetical protein [Aliiroseovarius sp. xm-m-354]NRP63038.1 hypothetical protein 
MIGRWASTRVEGEAEPTGFDSFEMRLGDVMRGERATLGKSLLDVQRELKIKATYIAAIENADASAFDTQGFVAGYVRSYARYLGLDPEWAFSRFCEESGFATAHGLSEAASSKQTARVSNVPKHSGEPFANPNATWVPQTESVFARIEPGAVGSVFALAALVGVLGFAGWSVLQEIQRVDFAPVEQSPGVLADLPVFEDGPELADAGTIMAPPSAEALDRLYRPQALDVPVMTQRDAPISTLNPRNVGVLAGVQLAQSAPPVAQPSEAADLAQNVISAVAGEASADLPTGVQVFGADAPEVALVAVRPSWVRIQSASGSVIFEKVMDAGEHYVLPKTESAPVLRTGNAGGIYFAVNGQAYGPAGASGSVVKNIALSSDQLTESFAAADLSQDQALATYVAELLPTQ